MEELDDIIGLPSGQIIQLNKGDLSILINLGFVEWSTVHSEFVFKDGYIGEIYRFIEGIYIGNEVVTTTGRNAIVKDIIKYDGNDINGKNMSQIFKIGDILYIIKQNNNHTGIYTKEQLKKVKKLNESSTIDISEAYELIGLPSGQIIEVSDNELDYLKRLHLIKWNGSRKGIDYVGYVFDDGNYEKIINALYELF